MDLPWLAVRGAWALPMTEVGEGCLDWYDTLQWALNCISSSQVAVVNSHVLSANSSTKIRIRKFYNNRSCTNKETMVFINISVHLITKMDH